MLLVWGRFSVSKTIIPDAQEHFLIHSTRRDTYLVGGLGFSDKFDLAVGFCFGPLIERDDPVVMAPTTQGSHAGTNMEHVMAPGTGMIWISLLTRALTKES